MTAPEKAPVFLTINYQLTAADLAAMAVDRETHRFHRTKTIAFWTMMALFFCAFAFGIYSMWLGSKGAVPLTMVGAASLVVIPLLRKWQPILSAKFMFKRLGLEGKNLVTTFSEDEITSASDDIFSTIAWSSIIKITRSNTHYFFWMNKVQAFIIPLNLISDDATAQKLWAVAEQNIK